MRLGELGQLACNTFRQHAWAFWVSNGVLTVINILMGEPWWALWPFLCWGLLFSFHYFVFKSMTVDESWSDERIDELRWKAYDLGHVEDLEDRIRGDDFSTRPAHRRDPDWWRRNPDGEIQEAPEAVSPEERDPKNSQSERDSS